MEIPDLNLNNICDAVHESLLVLDADLQVLWANRAFYHTFQITSPAAEYQSIYQLADKRLDIEPLRQILEPLKKEDAVVVNKEITHDFPAIGLKTILFNAHWAEKAANRPRYILLIIEDITTRKQTEKLLRESEQRLKAQYKNFPVPTYTWQKLGGEFVIIDYNDAAAAITKGGIVHYLGKTLSEMYGDKPEVINHFKTCYQSKKTVRYEGVFYVRSIEDTREFIITYVFVPPDIVMVHTEARRLG